MESRQTSATEEYLQQYKKPTAPETKIMSGQPAPVKIVGGTTIPIHICDLCEQKIWIEPHHIKGGCREFMSPAAREKLGIDDSKCLSQEKNGCANQGLYQMAVRAGQGLSLKNNPRQ